MLKEKAMLNYFELGCSLKVLPRTIFPLQSVVKRYCLKLTVATPRNPFVLCNAATDFFRLDIH